MFFPNCWKSFSKISIFSLCKLCFAQQWISYLSSSFLDFLLKKIQQFPFCCLSFWLASFLGCGTPFTLIRWGIQLLGCQMGHPTILDTRWGVRLDSREAWGLCMKPQGHDAWSLKSHELFHVKERGVKTLLGVIPLFLKASNSWHYGFLGMRKVVHTTRRC